MSLPCANKPALLFAKGGGPGQNGTHQLRLTLISKKGDNTSDR